jgi:hypothetical protein
MITGYNLSELVTKIQIDAGSKRDFIVDTSKIDFSFKEETPTIRFPLKGEDVTFSANSLFERQVAGKLQIPHKYWDKMRQEAPFLLESNVNYWFQNDAEPRMIRTLGDHSRAFLSKSYRPLDNVDIAAMVLPRLVEGEWNVKSSEITEQRMYIQLATNKIQGEVKPGDVVQAGLVISNSEVACGSLKVEPMVYRLICTNGMIATQSLFKRHLGKSFVEGIDQAVEIFSDESKKLADKAFWSQVNDIVSQVGSQQAFNLLLNKMQATTEVVLQKPTEAVEVISKRYYISDDEKDTILNNLITNGDRTQWGLVNAVTETANGLENYDRAIEIERIGGEVLELPATDVIFKN